MSQRRKPFFTSQSKKEIEKALRFVLIIEFWLEQGDITQALVTLQGLKKSLQYNIHS